MEAAKDSTLYTLGQIRHYWKGYCTVSGIRFQKDGKWHYDFTKKRKGNIDATRAELIQLSDVISFPKYLEKYAELFDKGQNGKSKSN